MIRESEETDEEMTLDAFLYRSDDFRKSTYQTPWPLPLQLDELEPAFRLFGPLFKNLAPKIRQVLAENSIKENQSWADIYLASKPGFPGGDIPVLTLVILVDQGINNSRTWGSAKDEVHQIFAQDHFPNVEVEFYDPKRSFVPTMFPLQPHTAAVMKYQSKRDQLIECLHEDIPGMWSAISVFDFGPTAAARAHPVTSILKLRPNRGFNPAAYHAIKGHVVLLPQNPSPLLSLLPSPEIALHDLIRVVWCGEGRPTDYDLRHFVQVRRQKILDALICLQGHNPLYRIWLLIMICWKVCQTSLFQKASHPGLFQ